MSFGTSVSDCGTILQLAKKLCERFNDAPQQFKEISNEVRNISDVLENIKRVRSQQVFPEWQQDALAKILQQCRKVLDKLEEVVNDNYHLNPSNVRGLRDKSRGVLKRLTWDLKEIQELQSWIAMNVGLLNAFNGSLISTIALETRDEVRRLHERHDRQELREENQAILDWLTPLNYAPQQHDFLSRRQEGTGQWLLDSAEYQAWLDTGADKRTLFCPGIPGAGKTILTSIVVEDLQTRFQNDNNIGITYFYCNFKRSHEQKLDDLLLSILKQLAQRQGQLVRPAAVKSLFNQHNENKTRPSTGEITKALESVISSFSKVFIIIDALDECQVNDRCRSKLISQVFKLQEHGANLFATSRFIPEITDQFKNHSRLEIRASDYDLRRYLDGRMKGSLKCLEEYPDLREKIKEKITKIVNGMFLLAELHWKSLLDKNSRKKIMRALEELPKGSDALKSAYDEAMERIKRQEPGFVEIACRVLSWITCAKRPLTGIELQHALAVEVGDSKPDKDNLQDLAEMESRCAGLVTFDKEGDIIQLVHYTAQEYFEQKQISEFPNAQKDIAEVCITYLSFDNFEKGLCHSEKDFGDRLRVYPFFSYAAKHWGHHARAASTELKQLILNFLQNEQKILASTQGMVTETSFSEVSHRIPSQMTAVHLAVFFELEEAILALLKNGYDIDSKDSSGQTPLSWAAENGHKAVTRLLLEKGAELDLKDHHLQTPLLWATRNGHETVVKLLLEKGAELDPILLFWAARKGHEVIVRLLLEKGVELEYKDKHNQTPVLWAARNGHETVVRLLLEKGSEVKVNDNYGRTPLLWAVQNEHEAVVRLLLEKSAKLELNDRDGRTPLSWAAGRGHEVIARLLIEKGAELESKDKKGRTPFLWAKNRKHEAMVKLLTQC